METADKNRSKVILANDPDADRLAIAEKTERYTYAGFFVACRNLTQLYYFSGGIDFLLSMSIAKML